jgi:transposase
VPQVKKLLDVIADQSDVRLPSLARICLESLVQQFLALHQEIHAIELRINAWHRSNEASRRLETIPGIGPVIASALAASISDPEVFKNGRELAAWIGLVPRQHSTGGKQRLGRISKQGDQYLRWLLVVGAMSVVLHAKRRGTTNMPWLAAIIDRKPTKVVAVALANRNARIVWALLRNGGTYQKPVPVEAA